MGEALLPLELGPVTSQDGHLKKNKKKLHSLLNRKRQPPSKLIQPFFFNNRIPNATPSKPSNRFRSIQLVEARLPLDLDPLISQDGHLKKKNSFKLHSLR